MLGESRKQSILNELAAGVSIKEVVTKWSISKAGAYRLRRELKKKTTKLVDHDLKLRTAQQNLKVQNKKYRQALDQIGELNKELGQYQQLAKMSSIIVPKNWKVEPTHKKEAIAVSLSSDWHIDEEVIAAEIGGVNAYNAEIGEARIETYFKVVLRLLNMCRNESIINKLVLGLLGDAISGWIHEEFLQANTMTPPEAILKAFELYVSGFDFLLREGNLDEITVVCCCGNHSRITKKSEVKRGHKKSWEWLMYELLVKWYIMKGETRIKFKVPEGYFNWLTICGKDVRFHHGNRIRYHGGQGGIHIPLRKAITQWNKARRADIDCLGHWHTGESSRSYMTNGSVVGYSEFAEFIKADFTPPEQWFFIIHPKYGKTAQFPIVLE